MSTRSVPSSLIYPALLALVVAASGCPGGQATDPVTPTPDPTVTPRADPTGEELLQAEPSLGEVVNTRRVVVEMPPGGACPSVQAPWRPAVDIMGVSDPSAPGPDEPVLCLFETDDERASPPFAQLKDASPGTYVEVGECAPRGPACGKAGYDVAVLAPFGVDREALRQGYAARTGAFAGAVGSYTDPARRTSRLVLLDSAPTGALASPLPPWRDYAAVGGGVHGYVLAGLAQELICGAGPCPVELSSRQVLGLVSSKPARLRDEPDEKGWGTRIDLARGIEAEVSAWVQGGKAQPLVLNLSLGWHPYYGGGPADFMEILGAGEPANRRGAGVADQPFTWEGFSPDQLAPDVRAVLVALTRARCEGAVVVAAAGNYSGGPKGRRGPLLPAAWQSLPDELGLSCARVGVRVRAEPAWPLVVAVGAVGSGRADLSVARPGARPPLLAYGDHATPAGLAERGGPQNKGVLTGTSVSSLVVAGTLATTLAYSEEPVDVAIRRVYEASQPVNTVSPVFARRDGSSAVFAGAAQAQGGDQAARLVRLCETIGQIGVPAVCASAARGGLELPSYTDVVGEVKETGQYPGGATTRPTCATRELYTKATGTASTPASVCPDLQIYSPQVSPWTLPQPVDSLCPYCLVDFKVPTAPKLWVEIEKMSELSSLTVVMVTQSGAERSYSIPESVLKAGAAAGGKFVMDINPALLPTNASANGPLYGIVKATITGVRDNRSLTADLTIVPDPNPQ